MRGLVAGILLVFVVGHASPVEAGRYSGQTALGSGTATGGVVAAGGGGAPPSAAVPRTTGPVGPVMVSVVCVVREPSGRAGKSRGAPIIDTGTIEAGTAVWKVCRSVAPDGTVTETATLGPWVPGAPAVTPEQLAQIAVAELVVPLPEPQMWPAADHQLTGLTTWLHVGNWDESTASASAAGVTVSVHARPIESRWRFPDGEVVCSSAGRVWSKERDGETPSCAHTPTTATFTRHSGDDPDELRVVVRWELWWTSTLGHLEPLPAVSRTSDLPLRIREYQVTTG